MSFTVYTPRTARQVSKGQAICDSCGNFRFHPADLEAAGIKGKRVVVLTDPATQRIALKAPEENPEFVEPTARLNRGKSGGKASVGLTGPLRVIGFADAAKVRGEHAVMTKDNLVIVGPIALTAAADKQGSKRKK